jgi:hypothetical protein
VESVNAVSPNALRANAPTAVPVEVAINPTGAPLTAAGGFSVPAGDYVVHVTPVGGAVPDVIGTLPNATAYVPDGSWVDGAGVPYQLSFGWTGSTGSVTDFHTISNAVVRTLNGSPPVLGVTLSEDSGGTAQSGDTVTYTAHPSITAANESRTVTLTDTFPGGLTPQTTGLGGTDWSCAVAGQKVTCTHAAAAPIGALPAVAMPVLVDVAAPTELTDTVVVASPDGVQDSDTVTQTFGAAPVATHLAFSSQPLTAQVNEPMTNPDASTTHVTVNALKEDGDVDTSYDGDVTITLTGVDGAEFVGAPDPADSLTVAADDGVADFSPLTIDTKGEGYTLLATADDLDSATSDAFDVLAAATACPAGQTCTTDPTKSLDPQHSVNATITGLPGDNDTLITATFGGDVAPIHPCPSTSDTILTFNGDRPKQITLTLVTKHVRRLFCYGQPTPFRDLFKRWTTYRNPANDNEYEGLLPDCRPRSAVGPCIKSVRFSHGTETVVIVTGSGDPHIAI